MELIVLVYISFSKVRKMKVDDLINILKSARRNNQAENITGMLLYRNGCFIQALEGEKAVVMRKFDTIRQDSRHRDVSLIYQNTIKKRSFGQWSMGFQHLDDSTLKGIDGYNSIVFDADYFGEHPSHAMKIMKNFIQNTK